MFRYLLICLMLFMGSAHAVDDDLDAVKKAAEQGLAGAQYNLGVMYANGEGMPENDIKAVRWFHKAAEQGDADAQYNLGLMYDRGEGVPEDDAEAVRWFHKAAEQGDAGAQFLLGLMYDTGHGVKEDDIQAYAWISVAAAQGVENAKEVKDILTGEMTRAEIAEAQKLSRKYWEAFDPGLNTQ